MFQRGRYYIHSGLGILSYESVRFNEGKTQLFKSHQQMPHLSKTGVP